MGFEEEVVQFKELVHEVKYSLCWVLFHGFVILRARGYQRFYRKRLFWILDVFVLPLKAQGFHSQSVLKHF